MIHALAVLAAVAAGAASPAPADVEFFEAKVRPVLAGTCVRCHGPVKASAGLRLDSREALLKGGENGPAVTVGAPDDSLILQAVRRLTDDVAPMPPDKPLPPEAVADIRRWVASGAPWPSRNGPIRADRHWAFEPVRDPQPPAPGSTPIDAFLGAAQRKLGVTPAPSADKRTLIRRATFDLLGLPPSPEEIEAFLADDSPRAFDALVDRLLASPRYGEKWGRLWLDVAHYADTAGETADFPVPDAWRYRDYVIAALNADTPINRFLREQLAGDLLARDLPADAPPSRYAELVTATGYLAVARRFGFDIPKDRHLTIDDTIDTFSKGMLGLTVACARCHDHKYDPVSADDYYALYGIFDSTRYPSPGCEKTPVPRDNVPLASAAEAARMLGPLRAEVDRAEGALKVAETRVRRVAAEPSKTLASGEIGNGGKADISTADGPLRGVSVRKGEMILLSVGPKTNHGADSTLVEFRITEPSGGTPARVWDLTRDLLADPYQGGAGFRHDDAHGNKSVWNLWDASTPNTPRLLTEFVRDAEGGKGVDSWRGSAAPWPCVFLNTTEKLVTFVTVRQPARSVALHPGTNGAAVVAWESSVDAVVDIAGRVEDVDPSGGDGIAWSVSVGPKLGEALAGTVDAAKTLSRAKQTLAGFAAPQGYAVAEGSPHNARVMVKGDPETLGPEVPRRFLTVLGGQPVVSGSGRRELAGWVTDDANPLTPRVIVNRVWQGHFGTGLVATPDNFGARGEPPTHPELLDWLTSRFLADGWSLKALHRRIMQSDAYRRSALGDEPHNAALDHDNQTLWRFSRRRLSAEEIRDALLFGSGDLDPTPGGPHPFPEPKTWSFTQHNPFTAVYDHNRRGVYLMTQRIKRHPFLALFDGADPNSCTGRRDSTTVPTQALFFLNDPFVHARAEGLSRRLLALPDDPSRLSRACLLLFGRPPREREIAVCRKFLASYASDHPSQPEPDRTVAAWAGWVRVMFSGNEFVYVD